MRLKQLLLFLFLSLVSSISAQDTKTDVLQLLNNKTKYDAGSTIMLTFNTTAKSMLYCSNSFGSTLVKPKINNTTTTFKVPTFISNKSGVINWTLITNTNKVTGSINVIPKEKPTTIETYLGPNSAQASKQDYTMFVAIPLDSLDNPLKDNTKLILKTQFLSKVTKQPLYSKDLIAYKKINSPNKSGRMLLSSEVKSVNSKEFDVTIMPALAKNFRINYKRNHNYADGNQQTTFYTSKILDKNNNIISDGTFVNFIIITSKGTILKTYASTIKGIATTKIVHPDYKDVWRVKAVIRGIAESNTISLTYQKAVSNFTVNFYKKNREITVGPIQSFMQQTIPDGLKVTLHIYKNNMLENTLNKPSKKGFATFKLNQSIYKKGNYTFKINLAGLTKTIENKKL